MPDRLDSQQPTSAAKAGPLRPLLPAQDRPKPSPPPARRAITQRRLNPVLAACEPCRKHKAKCSGERPTCRRCFQRNLSCNYVARPGESRAQALIRCSHESFQGSSLRSSVYEELINFLRNLPDEDAQDILRRLRSGSDPASLLNQVQAGDILLQMAVVPETRMRYEFPYRSEMPKEFKRDNPYLNSLVYEAASLYSLQQTSEPTASNLLADLGSEEQRSLYLKPFHAALVVDPLLSNVKVSAWTSVCDDDKLMRDLLSVLFRCEYLFTAAFQKDLFLEDMAARRTDFCSSLLVNVTLAYACVCYPDFSNRAQYWNPNNLVYHFMAEAKRLWELEASVPRMTTIQAGILFSVYHNLCGLDEVGEPYRIHAVTLAHELRIFDTVEVSQNERIQRGRQYLAWAMYNWETLTAFSFMLSPLLKKPPKWPLPDPLKDPSWYGEVWVKYPLNHGLSPMFLGEIIHARSKFRVIMNDFSDAAYSEGSGVSIDLAYKFRERLESWYDNLPASLTPRRIVLPGQLQLHIYYHHLLLTIFEPLSDAEASREPSPQRIIADAKKNIQTLVRLYYLRHGFEAMDLFIVIPLILMGYDCANAINEDTPAEETELLRSTLILVAQGLYNQRRNHYLAQALFKVIRGKMRPQEIGLLKSSMALDRYGVDPEPEMPVAVRSHWPVSVVKKQEDVESHILTNLVEIFGRVNVEEIP
ncbi:nitrogen assimilation transcription factor nit-4 [Fusarium beomiforme]|uniref:Nitrogen assimilation transcription factor nit-4 n=1 Tax=Fusarium beomiforme TaxID=44412 RepID=A0A9P5A8G4_9HYPO|nr:nitrogen assimilation transcription factor nit-4 [Fusarium beomiforme]